MAIPAANTLGLGTRPLQPNMSKQDRSDPARHLSARQIHLGLRRRLVFDTRRSGSAGPPLALSFSCFIFEYLLAGRRVSLTFSLNRLLLLCVLSWFAFSRALLFAPHRSLAVLALGCSGNWPLRRGAGPCALSLAAFTRSVGNYCSRRSGAWSFSSVDRFGALALGCAGAWPFLVLGTSRRSAVPALGALLGLFRALHSALSSDQLLWPLAAPGAELLHCLTLAIFAIHSFIHVLTTVSFLFRSLRSLAPSFTRSLYCAQNSWQMALSESSRDALWHCIILALAISGSRRSSTPLALGARLLWRQACWHSCYSTLDRSGSPPLWLDALGLLRRFWLKVPTPDCPCPRLVWFWFAPIFGAFRRSAAPTFSPLGPQPRFGPPSRRSSTALVLSCSSL